MIRWPFRLLLLIGICFITYMSIMDVMINKYNHTLKMQIVFIFINIIYIGILYRPILKGEFGYYFFNCNYENIKLFNFITKEFKNPKKQRKIYFKAARIKFDEFLASKTMVQIWGLLDLLTLAFFWRYFYNNIILVYGVLYNDVIVKFSMNPRYMTALVTISLLFSGILLIIPSKLGGRIVGVQMLIKMFAYLPSIFPILWMFGFSIEHRYIKALVITTLCVELIRVITIRHYFKLDNHTNYSGYDN